MENYFECQVLGLTKLCTHTGDDRDLRRLSYEEYKKVRKEFTDTLAVWENIEPIEDNMDTSIDCEKETSYFSLNIWDQ